MGCQFPQHCRPGMVAGLFHPGARRTVLEFTAQRSYNDHKNERLQHRGQHRGQEQVPVVQVRVEEHMGVNSDGFITFKGLGGRFPLHHARPQVQAGRQGTDDFSRCTAYEAARQQVGVVVVGDDGGRLAALDVLFHACRDEEDGVGLPEPDRGGALGRILYGGNYPER